MSVPGYPEYKKSGNEFLGEVPSHWELLKLKHCADVFPSNVDKKSVEGQPSIELCNYTNVYYNEVITDDLNFMAATATSEQARRFELLADDVVFTKDSETANDIGVAAYVPRTLKGVLYGYHLSIARPVDGSSGKFLKRFFDSIVAKAYFEVSANGLTRVGLGQYAVDNLPVALPPVVEQTQIARFLDHETARIDALIEEQQRLIELLKEKLQAVISHAVTKGLDPNVPMKDSGVEWLGEVPEHWEVTRIGTIYSEAIDKGSTELPVLRVSIHYGVSDRELTEEESDRKITRIDDREKYKRVRPGDLVYNMMRAWQGGFGAVLVHGLVSPAYVVARPKSGDLSRYVEQLLRTDCAVEEMRKNSYGITDFRLRLYWDQFKNIRIPLPPEEERRAIMERIDSLTAESEALEEEAGNLVEVLKERRSTLISAAVTGKIDVRNWQPDQSITTSADDYAMVAESSTEYR